MDKAQKKHWDIIRMEREEGRMYLTEEAEKQYKGRH